MKEYLEVVNKQVEDLVIKIRCHLTTKDRRKFTTILIIDIHARDVIDTFVRNRSVAKHKPLYGYLGTSEVDCFYTAKRVKEILKCGSWVVGQ
jgi:hypothetical protein